jgi:hypothetical protein
MPSQAGLAYFWGDLDKILFTNVSICVITIVIVLLDVDMCANEC